MDLNRGCPSKTVNGSGGGATLLKDPETTYQGEAKCAATRICPSA
ncbi:tRNA-dihydrouridine synthase [Escherichia coli]